MGSAQQRLSERRGDAGNGRRSRDLRRQPLRRRGRSGNNRRRRNNFARSFDRYRRLGDNCGANKHCRTHEHGWANCRRIVDRRSSDNDGRRGSLGRRCAHDDWRGFFHNRRRLDYRDRSDLNRTSRDLNYFNRTSFNRSGWPRSHFNRSGFNWADFNRTRIDRTRIDRSGFN